MNRASAIIEARGLKRHYIRGAETVKALDGVDLDIYSGESVCITGPSGSGKTTLVNLLSALDAPTDGKLSINGKSVEKLKEHDLVSIRRGVIGYVFQKFHLIPTLTVFQNVSLPLLFLGRREERNYITEVLDLVGLGERASHLPSELSGGQMQRVAIARALIIKPRVLIADEPTGNLDRQCSEEIFEIFLTLVKDQGLAFVLTTHNMSLADRCDRVIKLEDGRVVSS